MMKKNTNNLRLLMGLTLLALSLSLNACKDKFDELSGGAENLKFTQLMEATPYASAQNIIMSENSQYIIITQSNGNTTTSNYLSIDGGENFEFIADSRFGALDTYLSNDGKFILNNVN